MIKLTQDQYSDMLDENCGMCLKCHCEAYEVEPDAEKYECEECGCDQVYGLEALLLLGRIEFVESAL